MARPSTPDLLRPIDHALSRIAEDDPEGALRYAIPLSESEPGGALELFVMGYALVLLAENDVASRALERASQAAIGESNLPLALSAALIQRRVDAGVSDAAVTQIARAFGRGSTLLGERRAAPPSLPSAGEVFASVDSAVPRSELVERARKLLDDAPALPEIAARSLGPQALFSSLAADELALFAAIFQVRLFAGGAVVVEEGSVGSEAFVVARGELDVEKAAAHPGLLALHLARLGAGALVGEMALLLRSPRAATVTAARPSLVLVADKEALDEVAARAPVIGQKFAEHCKRRMLDNLVRTSPLFRAAAPAERPALVERFGIRTFEPGEKLARQGAPSEGLFLLGSGEVSIVHQDAADDRTLVTRLGPGDVVGEVALVLRRPAIADAVAQTPTVSLFLPKERFLELVRAHPKVFADLYEIASKRDEEIESISQEQATEGEDFILV
jgi:CRP-like cAMP-binding protein